MLFGGDAAAGVKTGDGDAPGGAPPQSTQGRHFLSWGKTNTPMFEELQRDSSWQQITLPLLFSGRWKVAVAVSALANIWMFNVF